MKINANERKVLKRLIEADDYSGFHFLNFKTLMRETRFKRAVVRRACRSLARKGLAEYGRGLWTEDGEVAGSGYCCAAAGKVFMETVDGR